jgi:hypothetical protein
MDLAPRILASLGRNKSVIIVTRMRHDFHPALKSAIQCESDAEPSI